MEHVHRIHHVAAQPQSPRVIVKIERNTREVHWTDHLHVDVQRHLMGIKGQREKCESNTQLVSLYAKRDSEQDNGHSSGLDQRKSGTLSVKTVHKEKRDKIAEKMVLTFAESGHPVSRATSPMSRGVLKSIGVGKLSIHYFADPATIETVFRIVTSSNQLSLYGAVAEKCEEYESYPDRTGQPVVRGQSSPSFVPSVIKTNIPLNDDPAHKEFLLQR